jgi:peroxiredoxin
MKKKYTILLTILVLIYSCNSHNESGLKQFTLAGTIDKVDTGIVVLKYFLEENLLCDTAKITNGNFRFKGKLIEPSLAILYWGKDHQSFIYLDPAKMKISLSEESYPEFRMTGSKTQSDFEALQKSTKRIEDKILSLVKKRNSITDSIKISADEYLRSSLEKRLNKTNDSLSIFNKKIDSVKIQFVVKNPASFCSVNTLWELGGNENISPDSVMILLNGLNNSLKNSIIGRYISDDIRKKLNVRPGALAPDFKALDINQKPVTLSQFKGKNVVLLDFWGSWCDACRRNVPRLKETYSRYHSKGLEIVAVTLDMDKQAWIDAIHKDGTEMWFNIPAAENYASGGKYITNDDIYKNYFVGSLPTQILISKEGKIINLWGGGSDDVEVSIDKTLSELLSNQ